MVHETLRYFLIAFVSSAALIVMSKIILQFLIRRPADYYDAAELYQEEMMLNSAGLSIHNEVETNPEGELTDEEIHVTPKLTVEEAVQMHLIERDQIKDIPEAEEKDEALEAIRKSLEEAYRQQTETVETEETIAAEEVEETIAAEEAAEPQEAAEQQETEATAKESDNEVEEKTEKKSVEKPEEKPENKPEKSSGNKKSGKRKPSMKMKKAELVEIAESMEIELPENATKKIILELINEKSNTTD